MVAHSAILNWSRLSKRRVDLTLGVTYKTGAEQMEELIRRLRELLAAQERVDPTYVDVYFVELWGFVSQYPDPLLFEPR